MQAQIFPAHTRSCSLPGDLQNVGRERYSSDSYENEIVGSVTGEAVQVIAYLLD
jgi:hypothetical protein